MANILYGINGEGSGHWTRSKEVIDHLLESGHNVSIVCSGRAEFNLKDDYKTDEIAGFSFKFVEGRIDKSKTLWHNVMKMPKFGKSFGHVSDLITQRNISHVITDFEPISCAVANMRGLPITSIDNMHFITGTDTLSPPGYDPRADITKAAINLMTPGADNYLALSFFPAKPKDKKLIVTTPILRRKIFGLTPESGDYLLVYLTGGLGDTSQLLRAIKYKFVVYGADRNIQSDNLTFKKFDGDEFLRDLAGSSGVLATAGFSLISEALFLDKPYLAWPVKNQFEQVFNAFHIERLGYGKSVADLRRECVESFLFNLEMYRENLADYPRQDNSKFFGTLDELLVG